MQNPVTPVSLFRSVILSSSLGLALLTGASASPAAPTREVPPSPTLAQVGPFDAGPSRLEAPASVVPAPAAAAPLAAPVPAAREASAPAIASQRVARRAEVRPAQVRVARGVEHPRRRLAAVRVEVGRPAAVRPLYITMGFGFF